MLYYFLNNSDFIASVIIIIKKGGNARWGESDLHIVSPIPTYLKKEEKGNTVETIMERAA